MGNTLTAMHAQPSPIAVEYSIRMAYQLGWPSLTWGLHYMGDMDHE